MARPKGASIVHRKRDEDAALRAIVATARDVAVRRFPVDSGALRGDDVVRNAHIVSHIGGAGTGAEHGLRRRLR
jgi:hypothetical protein